VRTRLLLVALLAGMTASALPFMSALAAPSSVGISSTEAVSGSAVVAEAEKYVGYPYAYVGDSPATGFSCIGFVWFVYHQLGQNIPGTLGSAMAAFPTVPENALLPGDIVFFQDTEWPGVSHVAIYIGGGKVIGADNPSVGVAINSLVNDPQDGNYWQDHYLVAERPWTGGAGSSVGMHGHRRHHHYLSVLVPSLNVRSGPGFGYSVRTVVTYGTRLRIRGWAHGWVKIGTPAHIRGWVVRAGVSVRRRTGPLDSPTTAARRKTSTTGGGPRNVKTIHVYGLRVHTAPSRLATVILTLVRGDRVAVLSRVGGWDKIQLSNGTVGWAMARFIGRQGHQGRRHRHGPTVHHFRHPLRYGINVRSYPGMNAPVIAVSNGYPVRVLKWGAGWAKVELSTGATGWVWRGYLGGHHRTRHARRNAVARPAGARRAVSFNSGRAVTAGVRVHSGPGFGYAVVSYTYAGLRAEVIGYSAGFTHVHLSDGVSGWIESGYVGAAGGTHRLHRRHRTARRLLRTTLAGTGPRTTATIRLHAAPGLSARVIGYAYAGEHLAVLNSSTGWDYVRLANGQRGYVDALYVTR